MKLGAIWTLFQLLVFPLEAAWAKNRVYHYELEHVTLIGTVEEQTFPGRPGHESIPNGDEVESGWYIKLDNPIDVEALKDNGGQDEPEKNVKTLQLTSYSNSINASFPQTLGRRVVLTGQLFHAFTAHHRARVLMRVEMIRADK